jgi:hypothetical protein
MPLLDHFHPPMSVRRHWEGFHSAWASAIAHQLNRGLLPPRFFAEPNVHLGGQVQIDVATFDGEGGRGAAGEGAMTAVWAPPRPALAVPADLSNLDVFEIQVINDEEGPRLMAAVELISPANKDRPSHRRAFAIKCASYLQQGVSVITVDVVTTRSGNLHVELLQLLELAAPPQQPPADLYAVANRLVAAGDRVLLEAWPEPLALGAALPTLPLWLDADCVLPLDLEQSYLATCDSLRIT